MKDSLQSGTVRGAAAGASRNGPPQALHTYLCAPGPEKRPVRRRRGTGALGRSADRNSLFSTVSHSKYTQFYSRRVCPPGSGGGSACASSGSISAGSSLAGLLSRGETR